MRNNQIEEVDIVLGPRGSEDETSVLQQYEQQPLPEQEESVEQCYKFLPRSLCDLFAR